MYFVKLLSLPHFCNMESLMILNTYSEQAVIRQKIPVPELAHTLCFVSKTFKHCVVSRTQFYEW